MLPLDVVSLFVAASVALAFAPGPDNLFVLTQSALHGRMAGVLVTLGLCTGVLVHTAAVALGVAAVFATSAFAFNALKIVGATYLLYLAWQAWRAGASDLASNESPKLTGMQLYRRGIIMNVTNPKVAIFFLAFLPQFADPERGQLTVQIFLLGLLFIAVALVVFCAIAWFAGFLGSWLRQSGRAQVIMNRMAAGVFGLLALRLVVAER
ncbi:MAG: LysE family translocator [Pseudomonadota bacterium]